MEIFIIILFNMILLIVGVFIGRLIARVQIYRRWSRGYPARLKAFADKTVSGFIPH